MFLFGFTSNEDVCRKKYLEYVFFVFGWKERLFGGVVGLYLVEILTFVSFLFLILMFSFLCFVFL